MIMTLAKARVISLYNCDVFTFDVCHIFYSTSVFFRLRSVKVILRQLGCASRGLRALHIPLAEFLLAVLRQLGLHAVFHVHCMLY